MFKEGQHVIISKLYDLRHDGAGVIIRQFQSGTDKGKYLVDVSVGLIVLPEERMVDAKQYWKETNVKRDIDKTEAGDSPSKKK